MVMSLHAYLWRERDVVKSVGAAPMSMPMPMVVMRMIVMMIMMKMRRMNMTVANRDVETLAG